MDKTSFARSPDFDDVVRLYRERYGVDLSHMRMKWSRHPVYNNGKRSYELDDDETGGSWVNDGTVRINPKMGPVMKRFGIEGMTQAEFRRRLIAHELAHEVWFKQNRKAKVKRLMRDILEKARKENFTTPYLDTYSPDTPKKKFDSELFAEYVSDQLNKKAGYEYEDIDDESVARHKKGYRNAGRIRLLKTTRGVFILKDGRLAGFVNTERKDDGKTWVQALEVAPEFRRQGIARKLLAKAVDDYGATDLTVRKTNQAARKLYDSEGWTPYKEEGIMEFRKKASAKKETYESGEGEVESYTPNKTEDHDEIVIRTRDGRRIRISNNTRLGKVLKARAGSMVGYHGWRIDGTNVVHKVHPNAHSRGGWLEEKAAMSRDRIQAQYARHPQESLERLAARLAKKKWGRRDVAREDAAHAEEFGITGEDKEYLDRYVIARIAEQYDRRARLKQAIMRKLWEKQHNGESFYAALPARMARFRQYEGSPFGKYDNPIEQAKYDEWASKSDEDMDVEWKKYLKS